MISVDFETRSTVDLRRSGVYRYAADPTTDVICLCWAWGDADPQVWVPGDPVPHILAWHVKAGTVFRAHNASFERIIWRDILGPRYGFPVPRLEQWRCTAAEAAAMALPRGLGECARVLGLAEQKDDGGHRLMLQMSKPRRIEEDGEIVWWDDEDRMSRLIEYCRQDVRTERAVAQRVRPLSDHEQRVYQLDQQINDRGVMLDIPLIEAAQAVVAKGTEEANALVNKLTDGAVTKVTKVADLTRWVQEQGVEIDNVQKATLREVLGC